MVKPERLSSFCVLEFFLVRIGLAAYCFHSIGPETSATLSAPRDPQHFR